MRKTKITALLLGILVGVSALSGCSGEEENSMEYVDVGALQNASLPEISAVSFETGGNSGADPDNSSTANSGNSSTGNSDNSTTSQSGDQSSDNSGGASSGESGGASSGDSAGGAPAGNKTAEIVIPKTSEYGIYIAEFCDFDPEKVKTALLGDVSVTPEVFDLPDRRNNVNYKAYEWNTGDVSLHADSHVSIIHLTSELQHVVNRIFCAPDHNHDGNIEEFKRLDEPLDFCTPEQAVNDIRGKLAQCGINVSANADVYALHRDEMQPMVDELCAEGRFDDPKDALKGLDAKPLTSYTLDKSDECYYIVFNEEFGGVPVYKYQFQYKTIKDLVIIHPEIYAVYTADGLKGLMVSEYRGNITESEKVTQLITPQSAVQAVTAKYSDMGASEVEFDKVELMYVVTPNTIDGKINVLKAKLTPVWVCTVYYTIWTAGKKQDANGNVTVVEDYFTSKETVLIDAVTGAEII